MPNTKIFHSKLLVCLKSRHIGSWEMSHHSRFFGWWQRFPEAVKNTWWHVHNFTRWASVQSLQNWLALDPYHRARSAQLWNSLEISFEDDRKRSFECWRNELFLLNESSKSRDFFAYAESLFLRETFDGHLHNRLNGGKCCQFQISWSAEWLSLQSLLTCVSSLL